MKKQFIPYLIAALLVGDTTAGSPDESDVS